MPGQLSRPRVGCRSTPNLLVLCLLIGCCSYSCGSLECSPRVTTGVRDDASGEEQKRFYAKVARFRGEAPRGDAGYTLSGLHGPCHRGRCGPGQACLRYLGPAGPAETCELTCGLEACPANLRCACVVNGPCAFCTEPTNQHAYNQHAAYMTSVERGDLLRGDGGFDAAARGQACGPDGTCAPGLTCSTGLGLRGRFAGCDVACGQEHCPEGEFCSAFTMDGPSAVCVPQRENE